MASETLSALGKEHEIFNISGTAVKVNEYSDTNFNVDTSYLTGAPNIQGSSSTNHFTRILFRYQNSEKEKILDLNGKHPIMDGQEITVYFIDGIPYYIKNKNTREGFRVLEGERHLNKSIPSIPILSFIWPFPILAVIISIAFVLVSSLLLYIPYEFLVPNILKDWGINFLLDKRFIRRESQAFDLIMTTLFVIGILLSYIWYARLALRRKAARQKMWEGLLKFTNS